LTDAADARAVEIRDFYDPAISSVADILNKISDRVALVKVGDWIHAVGSPMQDSRLQEKRFPTREELDRVAPDNPAYCHFGAHIMVANSQALAAIGINRDSPDPEGGWIMKDGSGEPNGVLRERAQLPLRRADKSKVHNLADGAEILLKAAASRGVTVVHDIMKTTSQIQAYMKLWESKRLPVRVQMLLRVIESDISLDSLVEIGLRQSFGDTMLKIGGSKLSIDGGFTGRQAAFTGLKGLIRIGQDELDQTVRSCHMAGIRCCIHAIGDEAQDMALLSLEKVQADRPLPDIRHRVEHLGNYLFTPERRAKAKRVHAVPVPNPSIFYFVGDMGLDYIGPNRNQNCYNLKTQSAEGFSVAFGSDATGYWPVDPIRDIAAMVNRKTVKGTLMAPEEAITFRQGIEAQTSGAAWVGFEENNAGSITVGRIADICVFDRDPDTCPLDELAFLPVALTVCAGKVSYKA
jgi:predicted amidohydrolase YtcJ